MKRWIIIICLLFGQITAPFAADLPTKWLVRPGINIDLSSGWVEDVDTGNTSTLSYVPMTLPDGTQATCARATISGATAAYYTLTGLSLPIQGTWAHGLLIYVPDAASESVTTSLGMTFAKDGTYNPASSVGLNAAQIHQGWNYFFRPTLLGTYWFDTGTGFASSTGNWDRARFTMTTTGAATLSFCRYRYNIESRAYIGVTLDDLHDTICAYQELFHNRGFRPSWVVTTNEVLAGNAQTDQRCTVEELKGLIDDYDWHVIWHGEDHTDFNGLSEVALRAQFDTVRTWENILGANRVWKDGHWVSMPAPSSLPCTALVCSVMRQYGFEYQRGGDASQVVNTAMGMFLNTSASAFTQTTQNHFFNMPTVTLDSGAFSTIDNLWIAGAATNLGVLNGHSFASFHFHNIGYSFALHPTTGITNNDGSGPLRIETSGINGLSNGNAVRLRYVGGGIGSVVNLLSDFCAQGVSGNAFDLYLSDCATPVQSAGAWTSGTGRAFNPEIDGATTPACSNCRRRSEALLFLNRWQNLRDSNHVAVGGLHEYIRGYNNQRRVR